eukprot:GHVS01097733.1.p1 GENE.GHVS01097733.1~~GHVS01097733.1.p1  ORF type:complete len:139 (-),score=18.94 GHVS01097733.1:372-788(-)
MTVEENLQANRQLWQDAAKFDKEHKYNIRHMYGQEGKRVNYPPLACNSVISPPQVPGPQDYHGCPFKHFDEEPLKRLMYSYGLSSPPHTHTTAECIVCVCVRPWCAGGVRDEQNSTATARLRGIFQAHTPRRYSGWRW